MLYIIASVVLLLILVILISIKRKKGDNVPEGLQVFDGTPNNNLVYDSNRLMKIHDTMPVSGNFSFTVNNPTNNQVFAVPYSFNPGAYLAPDAYGAKSLNIQISGNTVTGFASPQLAMVLIYGVY